MYLFKLHELRLFNPFIVLYLASLVRFLHLQVLWTFECEMGLIKGFWRMATYMRAFGSNLEAIRVRPNIKQCEQMKDWQISEPLWTNGLFATMIYRRLADSQYSFPLTSSALQYLFNDVKWVLSRVIMKELWAITNVHSDMLRVTWPFLSKYNKYTLMEHYLGLKVDL